MVLAIVNCSCLPTSVILLLVERQDVLAAYGKLVHGCKIQHRHVGHRRRSGVNREVLSAHRRHASRGLEGKLDTYQPGLRLCTRLRSRSRRIGHKNTLSELKRNGITIGVARGQVLAGKDAKVGNVIRLLRVISKGDCDGGDISIDGRGPMEGRTLNLELRASGERDADSDASEEADGDADREANLHTDIKFVGEWVPRDQEVNERVEPCAHRADAGCCVQGATSHDAGVSQCEIRTAFYDDYAAYSEVEAQARHIWKLRRLGEYWVIPSERQHELTLRKPNEEGEASGELTIARKQIGVVRELCLNRQYSLFRVVASLEREFHADQCSVFRRQSHAADA